MRRKSKKRQSPASGSSSGSGQPECFYLEGLSAAEKDLFRRAAALSGIDNEIALLRYELSQVLLNDPQDYRSVLRLVRTISLLVEVRARLNSAKGKDIGQAIRNALRQVAVPLGVRLLDDSPDSPPSGPLENLSPEKRSPEGAGDHASAAPPVKREVM